MARLREEYGSAGNARFFDQIKKFLWTNRTVRRKLRSRSNSATTENAVNQDFYRFRQRYQTLLREEIAHTVAVAGDVEDELRHLIAVFRP